MHSTSHFPNTISIIFLHLCLFLSLPDVWEEGNGAAVDEEERSLHGLTLNERFGFLEDHSQAASIGQITLADSIFLNELKVTKCLGSFLFVVVFKWCAF